MYTLFLDGIFSWDINLICVERDLQNTELETFLLRKLYNRKSFIKLCLSFSLFLSQDITIHQNLRCYFRQYFWKSNSSRCLYVYRILFLPWTDYKLHCWVGRVSRFSTFILYYFMRFVEHYTGERGLSCLLQDSVPSLRLHLPSAMQICTL